MRSEPLTRCPAARAMAATPPMKVPQMPRMCTCIIAPIVHARFAHARASTFWIRSPRKILSTPITERRGARGGGRRTLAHGAVLGLDTEFMRERTYYAQLCLVQMATDRCSPCCVDPLALPSLDATAPADGARAGSCKILHAARQDLEVLAAGGGRRSPTSSTRRWPRRWSAFRRRSATPNWCAKLLGRRAAQEPDPHRLVAPAAVGRADRLRAR